MSDVISPAAIAHLRWALTPEVGPILFSRMLVQFGDAERALSAAAREFETVPGIGTAKSDAIARGRDAVRPDEEIAAAREHGVRIICREDAEYPPGLKQIPDAPIVLYLKGELRETDAVAVAVVGSRRCTTYGAEQARRFGELLTGAGFTVVSGLARGVDAFAHHGAVDSGGRSIAVFGNGLSEVYPPENRELALKLLNHGAWISELPIRTAVRASQFPSRNRIIAGMTLGTLVVETQQRSGALITARLAGEYNREVFAIPGRVQEPMAMGTNALIRDGGGKLVTCLEDILQELGDVGKLMAKHGLAPAASQTPSLFDAAAENSASKGADPPRASVKLSAAERRVFEVIGFDPMLQEAVLSAAELPPGEVLAAFTTLELKGMIKRLPGHLVVRVGLA